MKKSWARDYFESIIVAVIFALFARTWVIQAFKIPSESMEDNLLVGDHILVNKFIYGNRSFHFIDRFLPMRGARERDVLVFKYPKDPDRDFIKRVIALGGDKVRIQDGQVYVDEKPLQESRYVYSKVPNGLSPYQKNRMDNMNVKTVDPGSFFVMGDNRYNSDDSRFWGYVPQENIKGRALLIYWSYAATSEEYLTTKPAEKLKNLASVIVHFPTRTRWSRSFRLIR
jgi:signal peptidase I